ncbi:adenine phosphoribosyltransferase [Reyranella sp. CPCC 100927]|uniref:adenine phosphoribosyltransferase n=1 Tax=Reyranella sp. CPCC 100927 TaxID=2599616 RepID=UPI001C49B0FF|nr:adenine phosphoribosyltransferase [Reyranella sp. CPCC 100927]
MPIDLKAHIRPIPDFPKPGILFYDITTLLLRPAALKETVDRLVEVVRPYKPDLLAGIESRGFIFGAPLAYALGCGFALLRKKGKLPGRISAHEYALEYGTDTLEIHDDAVQSGQRVVLIDDLLATGGTLSAGARLLRQVGATVPAAACVIELSFLGGRAKLDIPVETLVTYDS